MNATVTMPVQELDTMRNKIKELELANKSLEDTQKQVKLIVSERQHGFTEEWGWRTGIKPHKYYTAKDKLVEQPPVYVNFEDVVEELKDKVKLDYIEKIGELERQNIDLQKEKQEFLTIGKRDLVDAKEQYEKNIKEEAIAYTATIESLEKEIRILKGELVDLGKDEEIRRLKEIIDNLDNRTFFQRLFNIK